MKKNRPDENWMAERKKNGLCIRCAQPHSNKGQHCESCRKMNAKRMRDLKKSRLDDGLCVECGKHKHLENITSCESCIKKKKKYYLQYKEKLALNNKCLYCKKDFDGKTVICSSCIEQGKHKKRSLKQERQADGLCVKCGRNPPSGNTQNCRDCVFKIISAKNLGTEKRWKEISDLLDKQDGKCAYTKVTISPGQWASLDHIVPKNSGGSNDIENLQWVHVWINWAKKDMNESDFLKEFDLFISESYNNRLTCPLSN